MMLMSPTAEGRSAALHRLGGMWRLVVLRSGADGPVLIESKSIPIGDAATVRAALERHGVSRLVRVLPASSALCRVVEAPEGDGVSVASALGLIAEAILPPQLPAHRRAAAPLAGINGTIGARAALIVGWSGHAEEAPIGGVEETWTAEPAALLWLVRLRCRGALIADRATGSISAFAAGPQRVVVRSLREHPESSDTWRSALDECYAQTAAGAGLAASSRVIDANTIDLRLESGTASPLASLGAECADDRWMAEFGVAAGAAMGVLLAPVAMRPLHALTAEPRKETVSRVTRIFRVAVEPSRAPWVIAGALAAALALPLGLQAARHAILSAKSGGLAAQQDAEQRDAMRSAFHGLLESRRWPMTRLLADISSLMPVGIEIESARLETGQRVSLKGSAKSLDLANAFQARLNASGVFADAVVDRTQSEAGDGAVEFDISTRVVRPYGDVKGAEDFASSTLASRLYGAEGGPAHSAAAAVERQSAGDAGRAESGETRPAARTRSTKPEGKAAEIPGPISDDEIAKLDASSAMKQWTSRQKASKQSGIDAATRDRLKAESEKCRARMQAARKEAQ